MAEKLGIPLNQIVTINFTHLGIEEGQISSVLTGIRARYCRWAKRPGKRRRADPFEPAMIWVVENNGHAACHLLTHVPSGRLANFKAELAGWIEKECLVKPEGSALDVRPAHNPHGFRKYMLKGIDPLFAALYRIRHVPQGPVLGKRFGYTQNLGPSQCRKHGTKKPYRWPRQAG